MKRTSRQPSTLSHSLQRQLSMYALAATAAGVGMLAFVQPAEAKVVYTPAHRWLPLNQFYDLDLNHDGVNDFQFFLRFSSWFSGFYGTLAVHPQLGNAVFGKLDGSQTLACALPKGRKVGPKSPFFPTTNVMFFSYAGDGGTGAFGYWLNVSKQAYLGLKFRIKGKIHYGWARMGTYSAQRATPSGADRLRLRNHSEQAHHHGQDEGARCDRD